MLIEGQVCFHAFKDPSAMLMLSCSKYFLDYVLIDYQLNQSHTKAILLNKLNR